MEKDMKQDTKEFQGKDLRKINKLRIFKSKESEEVIEGVILNPTKVTQEEYIVQKDTKGKQLKKGIQINGKLEVMLDKENYDKLVTRNEINKMEALKEGVDINHFVDMFTLVECNGNNFKVLIWKS